ncbi:GerAB/ArcD/ProY family transporter [Paenibacillus sp. PL2-23]|uniref:GerAB/ArcD/ProY family transporter n=1 Tax=Paenibacillus sp. PL2-23 TaxID=2100729 RepID=UPI0030FD08C6
MQQGITPGGVFFLLFAYHTANLNRILSPLLQVSGFAALLGLAASFLAGGFFVWAALGLMRQLPTGDWYADGAAIVGRWPHQAVMLLVLLYFLLRGALELRGMAVQIHMLYLPQTPSAALTFVYCAVAGIAVRYGIVNITYFAQYFSLYTIPLIALVIGLSFSMPLNFSMLVALFTHMATPQATEAVLGGFMQGHWVAEPFFLLFLASGLSDLKLTRRAVLASMLLFFVHTGAHLVSILLSFGPVVAANMSYPVVEQLRFIRVGDFFENMDPVIMLILMPIIMLKISIYLYIATLTMGHLLKIKDIRPLAFTTVTLAGMFSLQFVSRATEIEMFVQLFWRWFAWLVLGIPLLYSLMARWRGISRRKERGA